MFSDRKRYRRDRDRVLGSRAFRRLSGKTQVLAIPSDPHVRTRLTHTLEVSSIAREVARALGLVDPLVDAIALGHDIGHPAFGHAGERALAAFVPGGFHHAAHGVRVVTELEPDLDLSSEVVDGILKHSKGRAGSVFARGARLGDLTREALVVRAADLFAYACHDLDDAYLLGVLRPADLPARARDVLGTTPAEVRRVLVAGTVRASLAAGDVSVDLETGEALQTLRDFLYERLYEGPRIASQTAFVRSLFEMLWEAALERRAAFDAALECLGTGLVLGSALARGFVDAVASMTDRQVLELARALGLPRRARSLPDMVAFVPLVPARTVAAAGRIGPLARSVGARDP
ncbi:MAG TPA: HD domain-containing protein [Polyangiaceae bacterium]|jgi:dGTPase|nr:HD domain-containing protein [Polyangiaceae bacterium]